jgi:hypothetical protein
MSKPTRTLSTTVRHDRVRYPVRVEYTHGRPDLPATAHTYDPFGRPGEVEFPGGDDAAMRVLLEHVAASLVHCLRVGAAVTRAWSGGCRPYEPPAG